MLGSRPWRTWRGHLKLNRQSVNSRELIKSKMEMNAKAEMFRETVEGQVKTEVRETVEGQVKTEVREARHGREGQRVTEMTVHPRQAAAEDLCICPDG